MAIPDFLSDAVNQPSDFSHDRRGLKKNHYPLELRRAAICDLAVASIFLRREDQ